MFEVDHHFSGVQATGERPYQEDSHSFAAYHESVDGDIDSLLLVLADGMGGESAGSAASETIVDSFVEHCFSFDDLEFEIPELLLGAMNHANGAVRECVDEHAHLEGMGATLLAVLIDGNQMYHLSVGDSPLYLYRDGTLALLNEDHSMLPVLQQEFEDGQWTAEELARHPERHLLRSAIIGDDIELVDCSKNPRFLEQGDVLIAASDGIQTLSDAEIAGCVEKNLGMSAELIAADLLHKVLMKHDPRQDNVSINVIVVPS